jgi:hypothetical protein
MTLEMFYEKYPFTNKSGPQLDSTVKENVKRMDKAQIFDAVFDCYDLYYSSSPYSNSIAIFLTALSYETTYKCADGEYTEYVTRITDYFRLKENGWRIK